MKHRKIGIVGIGRVGVCFAEAILNTENTLCIIHDLNRKRLDQIRRIDQRLASRIQPLEQLSNCNCVILSVQDKQIENVCRDLVQKSFLAPGTVVIHVSGSKSLSCLDPALQSGCFRACIHPLLSIADSTDQQNIFKDVWFGVDSDQAVCKWISSFVSSLGGKSFKIPESSKVPYHLGAVFASNFVTALLAIASNIFTGIGIDEPIASEISAQLAASAISNMHDADFANALTGPLVRGDLDTVKHHMIHLRKSQSHYQNLYIELSNLVIKQLFESEIIKADVAQALKSVIGGKRNDP